MIPRVLFVSPWNLLVFCFSPKTHIFTALPFPLTSWSWMNMASGTLRDNWSLIPTTTLSTSTINSVPRLGRKWNPHISIVLDLICQAWKIFQKHTATRYSLLAFKSFNSRQLIFGVPSLLSLRKLHIIHFYTWHFRSKFDKGKNGSKINILLN